MAAAAVPARFAQRQFLGPAQLRPWTAELRVYINIQRRPPLLYMLTHRWQGDQRWMTVTIRRLGHLGRAELLVHIMFPCPEDQAERLRERILEWQQAGGGVTHCVPPVPPAAADATPR